MQGVRKEKIRVLRDHDSQIVERNPINDFVAGRVSCRKIQRVYRFVTVACQHSAQPAREVSIHDEFHASVR